MKRQIAEIMQEYFDTIAPLLEYESNSQTQEIECEILALICGYYNREDLTCDCIDCAERVRSLQMCEDEAFLKNSLHVHFDAVFDLKMNVLLENNLHRIKAYDEWIFSIDLKKRANLGQMQACKLLACLYWMGMVFEKNRQIAMRIWSMLATNGDWSAIRALIYAYCKLHDFENQTKWENVLHVLQNEYESFSSVALHEEYGKCSKQEIELANLIMFIRQKNSEKNEHVIDRPMIHYILESKDAYEKKMQMLSCSPNYYVIMNSKDRCTDRRIGF